MWLHRAEARKQALALACQHREKKGKRTGKSHFCQGKGELLATYCSILVCFKLALMLNSSSVCILLTAEICLNQLVANLQQLALIICKYS